MSRPSSDLSRIPPADLAYVVSRLVVGGQTTLAEVWRLAGERSARIAAIQRELDALRAGGAVAAPPRRGPGRPPSARLEAPPKPKRKFTMTPKAKAARKLQGQYLGRLRKLTGADRAKVKAVAKQKGVAEAVKAADRLIGQAGRRRS
jgi:hypothetical protein